ncbi:hypothetical protein LEMLEM_LOCUS7460 [Lemmus lemmus]
MANSIGPAQCNAATLQALQRRDRSKRGSTEIRKTDRQTDRQTEEEMSLQKAGFGECEDRGGVCMPVHPCSPCTGFQTAYIPWKTGQFKVNNKYHDCQKNSKVDPSPFWAFAGVHKSIFVVFIVIVIIPSIH